MESKEVRLHAVLHVGGTVVVRRNLDGTLDVSQIVSPSLQVSVAALQGGEEVLTQEGQREFIGAAVYHLVTELVLSKLPYGRVSQEEIRFTGPGGVA